MSNPNQQHVEVIWGNRILDEGFTTIPNLIIRNYSKVGLTHGEYALLSLLFSFKHDANDPYPSQETLAKLFYGDSYKEDSSPRAIRKLLKSIEDKGLLEVNFRYVAGKRVSNLYNFGPLIEACLKLIEPKESNKTYEVKVAKKRNNKGKKLEEQKVPVEEEQKVPVGKEPKVPIKKKREKDNTKKKKEKESIYPGEINKLDLPTKIKSFLETKMDRLILHKIDLSQIEILFHAYREKIGHIDFILILDDVLDVEKYSHSFKAYFRKSLETYLDNAANRSEGKAAGGSKPSGRKEMVPDFMDDEKKEAAKKAKKEPSAEYLERIRKLKEKGIGVK